MKNGFLLPLLLIFFSACSVHRPASERQSFLLQPEHPAMAAEGAPAAGTLRIGRVDVARPYDGRAFVYRRDEVRFEVDFYNEFATDPADMVRDAAAAWLRQCGLFREVLGPRAGVPADYRLEASVSALYVDFRAVAPTAVFALRWRLLDDEEGKILSTYDFEQRIPLADRSPHGTAVAYRDALAAALGRLEREFSSGLPTRRAGTHG